MEGFMKSKLLHDEMGLKTFAVVFDKGDEVREGLLEFANAQHCAERRQTQPARSCRSGQGRWNSSRWSFARWASMADPGNDRIRIAGTSAARARRGDWTRSHQTSGMIQTLWQI